MRFQHFRHFQRCLAMPIHPQLEGLETAQSQERGHWRQRRPRDVTETRAPQLGDGCGIPGHRTAQHVAMTIDVFGQGMQHQICAVFGRTLQGW